MRGDFRLGDWLVQPGLCRLSKDGRTVQVRAKVMDLLTYLAERPGEVIPKGRLLDDVWGSQSISESALTRTVTELRQALGDDAEQPRLLETIPKRGYRLIAPVAPVREAVNPPASGQANRVSTRRRTVLAAGAVAVALLLGVAAWAWRGSGHAFPVTLAVLPFDNLGNDPEREALADGFTEETTASLGMIDPEHLSVKGRTSTLRYKRTAKSLAEIGRELTADYLVESTVRVEGGTVRVTCKLIRVRDQAQVWVQSYDREATSLLGLQRDLSIAIAQEVSRRLSPERLGALTRRQPQNAEAYVLYLSGRGFQNQATPSANARAIQYYERALTLEPDYALALSGLAFSKAAGVMNADAQPSAVGPLARDAAARAIQADPNLPEVQTSLGDVAFLIDQDWKRAEMALRRAIELDSRYALGHRILGHVLSQMGRHTEAAAAMQRAIDLEPLEPIHQALASQVAFQAHDYSRAVEHAQRALAMESEFWIGFIQLAQAYEGQGKTDLALKMLTNAERLPGGANSKVLSLKGYCLAKAGRANEARDVLRTLETRSHERYVPPYAMALVHAGLDEREAAFTWLDRAYDARDVHLMYLPVDSKWDPYRTHPRFEALLERCGFTQLKTQGR
jgi:DNA-binding winged helix-turn-helix (wHTH) protein/TolB-like protein/tetratricopeptide (TPR) repeat protein